MLPKAEHATRERVLDNIIERAIRFLLMTIKHPQSCLVKGGTSHSKFTIPICFKGVMGVNNEEMFKRHKVEFPEDKANDRHKKVHNYFELEGLHKNYFGNFEHWNLFIEDARSMLCLHCGIEDIPMPSKTSLNFVSVFSSSPSNNPSIISKLPKYQKSYLKTIVNLRMSTII